MKNFWMLTLALAMLGSTSRAADKVMPLGDSLTYGSYGAGLDGNGGYRAPLWNHLVSGGYNVDFVGSVTGPGPNTIDLNHEGHPGWRNDDLSNSVDGWMSSYQPGVIMLLAGANDIIQGASTATAIARLNVLLDKIIADRPNSPLIVSNLIYVRTPNDYNYSLASIQAYNAQIPGLVSTRAAQGKKIYFLDMYAQSAMVDSDLSADGIHPNDSGYAKMANVCYSALTPFLSRTSSDLRVNANGHYLEKSDGTPFFFLSDTEWLLNSHTDAQITQLLDDRKARGFTVVQVFATRNWNNGSDPACKDANGNLPFINNDPVQFNTAYWDRWRWIVDRAAERGLHFLLIYGEPGRLENPWKCSTNAQCYAYGHRVGDYFKDKSNMIFCNGQDSDANGGVGATGWRAMAEGVADGVNAENNYNNSADYSTTLMTYHGYSIYQTFQNDAWIDFYGQEVWHNNSQVYGTVNTGYNLTNPTKPIALLEGTYEFEDGVIFPGQTTPYYVRVEAYNTFFSGGFGYGFGNALNWQQFANVNYLSSPGNQQMGVLANFFKGREWWKLVPDQDVIASGENSGASRKVALKSADGLQCCVYFPVNEAGGIRMDRISSSNVNATWLDPRSGATQSLGSFARTAVPTIQPPSGWEDALLILTPGSGGTGGSSSFVKGINLDGPAVTVDGNTWISYSTALASGFTTNAPNSFAGAYSFTLSPTPDAGNLTVLQSALYRSAPPNGQGFSMSQTIGNGTYDVYVWMIENYQNNYRDVDVKLEGVTVATAIGELPLGGWQKYGPFTTTVNDGTLNIDMLRHSKGDPAVYGIAIFSSSPDTQAPSAPGNLAVSTKTAVTVSLAWNASTDNVGVSGYDVFRGGAKVGASAANSFTDSGLTPSTAYSYTVQAFDAAGNRSAMSNSVNVTTDAQSAFNAVSLHPANGHYFLFRNQPTVLLTSGEHYGAVINLDFDYITYLNELAAKGLNNTRTWAGPYCENPSAFGISNNTLAPAAGRLIVPWARSGTPGYANGGNKFDLNAWDAAYFARLKDFVAQAGSRGVVVELTLFCVFYDDGLWGLSPMNAANNVNGIGNIARDSVYTLNNGNLLAAQDAYVRKLITELNGYDNVIYEICNEPYFGVDDAWQAHIADTVTAAEATLPQKHLLTQNIANGSTTISNPNPKVSVFNFHYCRPPDAVAQNFGLNKVIGNNETGFDGAADVTYRTQAWDFLIAGGGLFDNLDYSFTADQENGTSVQNAPGGGSPTLRAQYKILKNFMDSFNFVAMTPNNGVLAGGVPSSGRALVESGKQYAIYLNGGTSASLSVTLPSGTYHADWVNTKTGATDKSEDFTHGGGNRTIVSPAYSEDIALRIKLTGTLPPPPDGLIVDLKFDEASGTVAADSSGNGNNGALINGPALVAGKMNNAVSLDGQNDYVSVSNASALNALKGQMTVALWIYKRADAPTWGGIAGRRFGSGYGDLWNLFYDNSGTDDYIFHVLGSSDVSIHGPSSSGDVNKWVHLAGVYDGSTLRLYRNGVQVASGALSGNIPDESSPLVIGAGDNGTNGFGEYINALVDDFHLYNRALSASEIGALMAGSTTPPGGGSGTILREVWTGVSGTTVATIPLNSAPNQVDQPTSFEAPTNWADNYGTRMRGYVYPPASGSYSFWIAGDDNSELWLSTDANPATKVRIANVSDWTNSREWTKFPSQHSAAVTLTAGQKYYIEALQKEGSGGDNLAVAWDGPGISQQVIAGQYLSPWLNATTGSGTGLRGDYFDNSDFTAQKMSRVDATVNFDWSTGSPDATIGADTFSVRWTGQIQAQFSETYTFYTVSDDGVRLWVNGQLLVDNWTDHAPTENSGTIALVAGQLYDIKLELYENGGGAVGKLLWSSASTAKDVVPTSQLYPANATTPAFTFYRAINLNGVATTIDGNAWEGKTAPNYSFNGSSFENQSIVLSPATDANRAAMIRSSIWNSTGSNVTVGAMPSGNYRVYLYVWEDNFSQTFSISLEGNVVQANYASGVGGHWDKLGPWDVAVNDGALNLTCSAGDANLSGIEIWQAPGGATGFATKSVNLAAAPSAGDSDGDGLLDAYEIAVGLDPNNPDSDGNGILDGDELVSGGDMTQSQAQQIWLAGQNAIAAPLPFAITKLSGKVSASKPGKDSVSAVLSFKETVTTPNGAIVSIDIAGAKGMFTLDKNGRARNNAGAVMLVKSKKSAGTQVKVKLVNRTAAGYWLDAGIAFSKSKGGHMVHAEVNINGTAYATDVKTAYTIGANQSLSFKFTK